MLAIRFTGMAWRFQYGAPLMAAVVMVFLPLLRQHRPPAWVLVATGLLLYTTNDNTVRAAGRTLFTPAVFPAHCPATAPRLASVRRALDVLAENPGGRVLLEGNLVAEAGARDDVFAVGGPQPDDLVYDLVLVEKPPAGSVWPLPAGRMEALIDEWRSGPGTQVLVDDAHVFFARGRFTVSR